MRHQLKELGVNVMFFYEPQQLKIINYHAAIYSGRRTVSHDEDIIARYPV